MLISRARRFVFVHVQKTGGTSVKEAIRGSVPDVKRLGGTHDAARDGLEALGEAWGEHFSFAFVRNPWERLVSWYAMIEAGRDHPKVRRSRFARYVLGEAACFEDFVVRCTDVIDDHDGPKSIAFDQLDYLSDGEGREIVDFVGRFEQLAEDATVAFEKIGLAGLTLPRANVSPHRHYSAYYSPALRDLVGARHERDLRRFGYRFEAVESDAEPEPGAA